MNLNTKTLVASLVPKMRSLVLMTSMPRPRLGSSRKSGLGSSSLQKSKLLKEGRIVKAYCFSLEKMKMNYCTEVSVALVNY